MKNIKIYTLILFTLAMSFSCKEEKELKKVLDFVISNSINNQGNIADTNYFSQDFIKACSNTIYGKEITNYISTNFDVEYKIIGKNVRQSLKNVNEKEAFICLINKKGSSNLYLILRTDMGKWKIYEIYTEDPSNIDLMPG